MLEIGGADERAGEREKLSEYVYEMKRTNSMAHRDRINLKKNNKSFFKLFLQNSSYLYGLFVFSLANI